MFVELLIASLIVAISYLIGGMTAMGALLVQLLFDLVVDGLYESFS
jgi:hypothetical protein